MHIVMQILCMLYLTNNATAVLYPCAKLVVFLKNLYMTFMPYICDLRYCIKVMSI